MDFCLLMELFGTRTQLPDLTGTFGGTIATPGLSDVDCCKSDILIRAQCAHTYRQF